MSLPQGRRLGPYEVLAPLGAGGMGEVYRARDPRLGRDVALKLLPDAFARDPDRRARFAREAKLLASLSHPNIAAIHGLEEADGTPVLVLELAEGVTLAERIARGPVPVDEMLAIARQVAEALEAAHEKAIVHRDLKPGNVKLAGDGKVKVLDFGLAKALEEEAGSEALSDSPTLSRRMTEAGLILGTAAYMAPEQARGKAVDKRADVWAFGVMLWEMLTGKRPFEGETVSDTLAAVLTKEPDWDALPAETPSGIRRLLRHCLERDPRRRLHDIADARIEIEEASAESGTARPALDTTAVLPARGRWRRLPPSVPVLAAVALGLGLALGLFLRPAPPAASPRRFGISVPELSAARISPDGRRVAYVAGDKLWVRDLGQLEPRALPGTEGAVRPFWSHDGAWLAYGSQGRLWKVPVDGGPVKEICELPDRRWTPASGGAWQEDGTILFTTGDTGLMSVPAQGGTPALALDVERGSERDYHDVSALPGGRGAVFVIHGSDGAMNAVAVYADGKKRILQREDRRYVIGDPVVSPTRHLLYTREGPGLWAFPLSRSGLEVSGKPFPLARDGSLPSVAADGTLVYVTHGAGSTQLVWVRRDGGVEGTVGPPEEAHWPFPALSPDGRRVAVCVRQGEGWDVWIHDLVRGVRTRLTTSGDANSVEWSPDGSRLVYYTGWLVEDLTLWLASADGRQAERLGKGFYPSFSPDGRLLVYTARGEDTQQDLWFLPLKGDRTPSPFLRSPARELQGRVSPDGRLIAYVSDASGRNEIYLRPFPGGEGLWQVSIDGGSTPRWSRRGDRLYYGRGDDVFEVDVTAGDSLVLGPPRRLFTRKPLAALPLPRDHAPGFDVSADGERFLIVQSVGKAGEGGFVLVENWWGERP